MWTKVENSLLNQINDKEAHKEIYFSRKVRTNRDIHTWCLHDLIQYFLESTLGSLKIASPRKLLLDLRAVNNSEILVGAFPFPITPNTVINIFASLWYANVLYLFLTTSDFRTTRQLEILSW